MAVSALVAVIIGRVFGIIELFVIGAGLGAAVGAAVLVVRFRRPTLDITRWVHPAVMTVGDTGRVDLVIQNLAPRRAPKFDLAEPVGPVNTARMSVAALAPHQQITAGYRVPAGKRGVMELGPLELERRDVRGRASWWTRGAPATEVMIAPRTHDVAMPILGHGVLGRHLLTQAQRLGPGEFHSLRDYVVGDELRSIHWRASARSEELKVRQHTTEGVRRCIVLLDRDRASYDDEDAESFERAIVAAASVVQSADRAGLTTRFVTSGGIDLRGPDVASNTLRVLAPIALGDPLGEVERDPGEGLGLVVVVTPSASSAAWHRAEHLVDPTLARVGVFTSTQPRGGGRMSVNASSIDRFLDGWEALAGHGRLDLRARIIAHVGGTV